MGHVPVRFAEIEFDHGGCVSAVGLERLDRLDRVFVQVAEMRLSIHLDRVPARERGSAWPFYECVCRW